MYYDGKIIQQNLETAARWFAKAAEQGDNFSQAILGSMYLVGHGLQQDNDLAYQWSDLAAARGNELAIRTRDFAAARIETEQLDRKRIKPILDRAKARLDRTSRSQKPKSPWRRKK